MAPPWRVVPCLLPGLWPRKGLTRLGALLTTASPTHPGPVTSAPRSCSAQRPGGGPQATAPRSPTPAQRSSPRPPSSQGPAITSGVGGSAPAPTGVWEGRGVCHPLSTQSQPSPAPRNSCGCLLGSPWHSCCCAMAQADSSALPRALSSAWLCHLLHFLTCCPGKASCSQGRSQPLQAPYLHFTLQ